jgi:addiction module HigA family antidote
LRLCPAIVLKRYAPTETASTVSVSTISGHPGEHLAEELDALNLSAAELARKMAVPTNRVTQILNGARGITGDTALRLAHFFATSAQFWLNLQTLYDLRVAHRRSARKSWLCSREPSNTRQ